VRYTWSVLLFAFSSGVFYMSVSKKTVARTPLHKRAITVEVFEREDGLWDLDAQLIDTKRTIFLFSKVAYILWVSLSIKC